MSGPSWYPMDRHYPGDGDDLPVSEEEAEADIARAEDDTLREDEGFWEWDEDAIERAEGGPPT